MGQANGVLSKEEVSKYWTLNKRVLGKGTFAEVREAKKKNPSSEERKLIPETTAAKVISKAACSADDLPMLKSEVDIMKKIQHQGCVRLFEVFDSSKHLVLMVELCTGGELFDAISQKEKYGEDEAADVIRQLTSALKYMHEHNIIHRDLKPENIIYETDKKKVIKVTDFGLAKYIEETALKGRTEGACGTPSYVAPEVIASVPQYTTKVDMWAVGVILYILLCGFPPFFSEENNMGDLFRCIRSGYYTFPTPFWDNVSEGAKDLISKLLEVNVEKRYSALQVLEHPWVSGVTDGSSGNAALGRKAGQLGRHVQDGITNIQAKIRWKKAQARIKIIRKISKIQRTRKTTEKVAAATAGEGENKAGDDEKSNA
jgi:serine/threonine protein kinase|eukprot:g5636.t1